MDQGQRPGPVALRFGPSGAISSPIAWHLSSGPSNCGVQESQFGVPPMCQVCVCSVELKCMYCPCWGTPAAWTLNHCPPGMLLTLQLWVTNFYSPEMLLRHIGLLGSGSHDHRDGSTVWRNDFGAPLESIGEGSGSVWGWKGRSLKTS